MANWVTLKNGVHIDLDDENNPITGDGSFNDLKASSKPYKDSFKEVTDYRQINIHRNGLVDFRPKFGGKKIIQDEEAVLSAIKHLGIGFDAIKGNDEYKKKIIDYLKEYSPNNKQEDSYNEDYYDEEDDGNEIEDNFEKNYTSSMESIKQKLHKEINDASDEKGILEKINDFLEGKDIEYSADGDITYDNYKCSIYKDSDGSVSLFGLTNYKTKSIDLLKSNGIDYEYSKQSNSLYFTHKGQTYRISDHRMPQILDGYASYDRNDKFDHNIVIKDVEERFEKLKQIIKGI